MKNEYALCSFAQKLINKNVCWDEQSKDFDKKLWSDAVSVVAKETNLTSNAVVKKIKYLQEMYSNEVTKVLTDATYVPNKAWFPAAEKMFTTVINKVEERGLVGEDVDEICFGDKSTQELPTSTNETNKTKNQIKESPIVLPSSDDNTSRKYPSSKTLGESNILKKHSKKRVAAENKDAKKLRKVEESLVGGCFNEQASIDITNLEDDICFAELPTQELHTSANKKDETKNQRQEPLLVVLSDDSDSDTSRKYPSSKVLGDSNIQKKHSKKKVAKENRGAKPGDLVAEEILNAFLRYHGLLLGQLPANDFLQRQKRLLHETINFINKYHKKRNTEDSQTSEQYVSDEQGLDSDDNTSRKYPNSKILGDSNIQKKHSKKKVAKENRGAGPSDLVAEDILNAFLRYHGLLLGQLPTCDFFELQKRFLEDTTHFINKYQRKTEDSQTNEQ